MRYLQCGLAAEGPTDHRFLGPLLLRLVDDIVLRDRLYDVQIPEIQSILPGDRACNDPAAVSVALRRDYRHLDLVFVHSDAKGNPARAYAERVAMVEAGPSLVVGVVPRHETEAWIISQPQVVAATLGVDVSSLGVGPEDCRADVVERNADPKAALASMMAVSSRGRRRRHGEDFLGVWAQRLDLDVLGKLSQGRRLITDTRDALRTLGVIT